MLENNGLIYNEKRFLFTCAAQKVCVQKNLPILLLLYGNIDLQTIAAFTLWPYILVCSKNI